MAKGNRSKENRPPGAAASSAPPLSRRRLRLLLAVLLVVAGGAGGYWVYDAWPTTLPETPTIDLDGIDPEVAEALAAARAAVVAKPRSVEAWARLAMTLDAHHYPDAAVVCYGAVRELDRSNALWPYLQGVVLQSGSNPESALPPLERASRLAPSDSPMPRLRLADLLLDLGRIDEADKLYRKVLADNPRDVHAQFGLAQVCVDRHQHQEALRYLRAVAHDPQTQKRACALSVAVHERLGDRDRAEIERRRLTELPQDPPWPDILDQVGQLRVGLHGRLLRAQMLVQEGKNAEATALIDATVRKYPESDQAWAAAAYAREVNKDLAGAEKALHMTIQLAPERAVHHFTLGEFLLQHRRYTQAAAAFRKTIDLRPVDADAYLKLGDCLQRQGDHTGAGAAYRQALHYRPDMNEARLRLEKLK